MAGLRAALWLCVAACALLTAFGRDVPQRDWRTGRFCKKHPANCHLMEQVMPLLLRRLSRHAVLKALTESDVFRLTVLALLRHHPDKTLSSADELVALVDGDVSNMLKPLPLAAPLKALAEIAGTITRNTPACYSVTAAQLVPAWNSYVNFVGGVKNVKETLPNFQMRVKIHSAIEVWRHPTFSFPRWIAMLWIDGLRQSLLSKATCGIKTAKQGKPAG